MGTISLVAYRQRAAAAMNRVVDAWLPAIYTAAQDAFAADEEHVLNILSRHDLVSSATGQKISQYYFEDSPSTWRRALKEPLKNLTATSGKLVSQYILDQKQYLTEEERWFLQELLFLSKQVTETSRERVLWILALALALGWNTARTRTMVRLVFRQWTEGDVSPRDLEWTEGQRIIWRGDIISRTEGARFANLEALQRYLRDGVPYKIWATARDDRVCPYCSALDGKLIHTSDPFFRRGDIFQPDPDIPPLVLNYVDVLVPPLHPKCRCTVIPWRPRWGDNPLRS